MLGELVGHGIVVLAAKKKTVHGSQQQRSRREQ
jgi:hypothetical protein